MARKVTKKGALQVSQTLDRLASLFEQEHEAMGVTQKVAQDFALRLDHTSDIIEKSAGIRRAEWDEFSHGMAAQPSFPETDGFDPTEIAKTEPGALESDPDEPYVRDNFTEQETNELSDKHMTGQLPYADVLPEQDMLGKLAAASDALVAIADHFKASKR
jgi:hypothetical protein